MKKKLKIVSWNVNGIRACVKKGFIQWLTELKPDICCIQETKIQENQLTGEIAAPKGYKSHWFSAEKKGYSGLAFYVKKGLPVEEIVRGIGHEAFDSEGRAHLLNIGGLQIINTYFPNSRSDHSRLDYKLAFNDALLEHTEAVRASGKHILICGDFNVAHKEIDLKNPKSNVRNPGFLPEERDWMTRFLEAGYVDSFRRFYPDLEGQYTWWSYRFKARQNNTGWRIDYFCVNREFQENLVKTSILKEVMGSDHCPVFLEVKLP